jgi:hypothetical protein
MYHSVFLIWVRVYLQDWHALEPSNCRSGHTKASHPRTGARPKTVLGMDRRHFKVRHVSFALARGANAGTRER